MAENSAGLQINLRPMTWGDLNQVEAIDRAVFSTPWPKEAFSYELKRPHHSVCWVAEVNGSNVAGLIVGTIVIWLVLDEGHIGTLAVRAGYRQQGIAQRLLAAALLECSRRGTERALLEVRVSNQPARELYQKFGFATVGVRHGYYQDTHEDALLMTLTPLDVEKLANLQRVKSSG